MNVTNLILQLQSKISSDPLEQQAISKAIKLLSLGAVDLVETYNALPAASTNTGSLYLVSYDGLYYSNGEVWVPIATTALIPTWTWGCNCLGATLGDNTNADRSSPVRVVGGFTDWVKIVGTSQHTMGIRSDGSLWNWGTSNLGRRGNGFPNYSTTSSPVSDILGGLVWRDIGSGRNHSLGITTQGTLWAWGSNADGLLGDGTVVCRSSPVSVSGGGTDWCALSTGTHAYHSFAIKTNGTLWGWGNGLCGALGNGSLLCRSSPVSVVGGFTDWCQVSTSCRFTSAVRANGTLWSWGYNINGQLGDGTVVNRSSPVSVVGGFTDWRQVAAGFRHMVAVRANGTLWSWGCNFSAQLGHNTSNINTSSPVTVVGGFTDWCQAAAGYTVSGGVRTNGTAWTWGTFAGGVRGDNDVSSIRSSPVSVVGGFTDWCSVSFASTRAIAIRRIST